MIVTSVQIKTAKTQKHLYCLVFTYHKPAEMRVFPFLCGFSAFLVFANLAVSCGLFAYRLHRNYTVKYPLQLRRGHLFTTPSLTLRVPRTKGAFALCLRLERPYR